MGLLRRLHLIRTKQVLVRRFGREWGSLMARRWVGPDFPFKLGTRNNLLHEGTGLDVMPNVSGVEAMVGGSENWEPWAKERGLKFVVEGGQLYVEVSGVRLQIDHWNDYFTLKEVFHEEIYRFELPGDYVFVDVGANMGFASLYLASRYSGNIESFELVPSTAKQAQRNIDLNPSLSPRIKLNPYGLGAANRRMTIKIDPRTSAVNSWVNPMGSQQEDVEIRDASVELERILAENSSKRVWVKLDAEGAEYEIIRGWSERGLLEKVDVLVLEWHEAPGESMDSVREQLKRAGLHWFERMHSTHPVGFMTAWRDCTPT
jgi:FkbM family methyltransferase